VFSLDICAQQLNTTQLTLIPFQDGSNGDLLKSKWGFKDSNGKVVISPQFGYVNGKNEEIQLYEGTKNFFEKYVWPFKDGYAKILVNPKFWRISEACPGILPMMDNYILKEGKFGFIDVKGNYIVEPNFDYAQSFSEKVALVKVGNKYGYIDGTGKYVLKPMFDYADDIVDGYGVVYTNNKCGVINNKGKYLINPQYDCISRTIGDIVYYYKKGIRSSLRPQIKPRDNYIIVYKGDKSGIFDKNGKAIIKLQSIYNIRSSSFYEGLCLIEKNNKYGYIDKTGKIIIQPKFESYDGNFVNGIAVQELNNKYGYIDKKGNTIIKFEFDWAENFKNGQAIIWKDNDKYLINKSGKIIKKINK
jgi:hypothetical protein